MKPETHSTPAADLRRHAAERLEGGAAALTGREDNPRRLLHELQVHQIELEMQNEQLEAARAWIEAALASYTELFDCAPMAYFTLDRTGRLIEANLAGAAMLGVQRALLQDMPLSDFVAVQDRSAFDHFLKRAFEGQLLQALEFETRCADGSDKRVEMRVALADGGASCRAVLVNVSARAARERRLERLASVFSQAVEGMFIADAAGLLVEINDALSAAAGVPAASLLGQPAATLFGAGRLEPVWAALDTDGSWCGELPLRQRGGTLRQARVHAHAVPGADGSLRHWVFRIA
ncbi:MAG: PAS domain S-box protein [Pseudomonadota bacterium]